MQTARAILFDLDDTLAESFQAPKPEMVERLSRLLEKFPIGIITAAGWPRIEEQFLTPLSVSSHIENFYVFPNSSSQCHVWENGAWKMEYNLLLTDDERARITSALTEASHEADIIDPRFESRILDRGTQIAYAAIGLDASLEEKKAWDPDQSKRKKLKALIESKVPDVEVLIGGMTTIDITKKGINKSYGVKWFSERLNVPTSEILYVGDAFYEGGNDRVVIPTGIQIHQTSGPEETLHIIDDLLQQLS